MEGLTLQIYDWLIELGEQEAADFLSSCLIDSLYQDTLFEVGGGDSETDMFDVIVYAPIKIYKTINDYSAITAKIEEAITESAQSQEIYVRRIEWKARLRNDSEIRNDKRTEVITGLLNQDYVQKQVRLMHQSMNDNPHLALGTAKELIETCCKSILKQENVAYERDWDILKLVRETNKVIDLIPFVLDNKETAKTAVAKIIGGFSNIVHGVTELRNSYGTGHGHDPNFKMLDELYVKLAVTAAGELAVFYLTLQKSKEKKSSS
jgi:succinate dehydrogenase/fumarate reductase flavoprotein subunit